MTTFELESFCALATAWAASRPDVRGLALVGSLARGDPHDGSDVDLVLLTDAPGAYLESAGWEAGLGATAILDTRGWGELTERRLLHSSGVEIDLGVVSPRWAATDPVDPGTRRVASEGLQVLYDPDDLLTRLVTAL